MAMSTDRLKIEVSGFRAPMQLPRGKSKLPLAMSTRTALCCAVDTVEAWSADAHQRHAIIYAFCQCGADD
jgi:hypothetical protein